MAIWLKYDLMAIWHFIVANMVVYWESNANEAISWINWIDLTFQWKMRAKIPWMHISLYIFGEFLRLMHTQKTLACICIYMRITMFGTPFWEWLHMSEQQIDGYNSYGILELWEKTFQIRFLYFICVYYFYFAIPYLFIFLQTTLIV